jgi:hypothetical protein
MATAQEKTNMNIIERLNLIIELNSQIIKTPNVPADVDLKVTYAQELAQSIQADLIY